jgi:hypothetical protein
MTRPEEKPEYKPRPVDILRRASVDYAVERDPRKRLEITTASLEAAILMLREASATDAEILPLVELATELHDWAVGAKPPMLSSMKRTAAVTSDKWLFRLMSVIVFDAMSGMKKPENASLQNLKTVYDKFNQGTVSRKQIDQWRREASREKPKMGAEYALHLDAYHTLRKLMHGDTDSTARMDAHERFERAEKTALSAMAEAGARLRG